MKFTITVARTTYERGTFEVEAATENEAIEAAEDMMLEDDADVYWNCFDADNSVLHCEAEQATA